MQLDETVLRRIWETELEIMDVIHDVCQKHNLKYSLAFGSLIGAIRHKGFIPWDDDIDLVMPRKDYNRLIEIWGEAAPKEYILQNKDTDRDFAQNFVKIRKNNTTFLQDPEEMDKKYHKGIFVDIAPCDRVARGKLRNLLQYMACAVNLLYSKEHISGTGGMIGVIERVLLLVPRCMRPRIRKWAEKVMQHWDQDTSLCCFCSDTIQNCKRYFPADLFDSIKPAEFQGREYCIIGKPDDFLTVRYINYMQLPPEEERVWKHHPIIIDFEHNYEELNYQA